VRGHPRPLGVAPHHPHWPGVVAQSATTPLVFVSFKNKKKTKKIIIIIIIIYLFVFLLYFIFFLL
jgi:hypothetical protein